MIVISEKSTRALQLGLIRTPPRPVAVPSEDRPWLRNKRHSRTVIYEWPLTGMSYLWAVPDCCPSGQLAGPCGWSNTGNGRAAARLIGRPPVRPAIERAERKLATLWMAKCRLVVGHPTQSPRVKRMLANISPVRAIRREGGGGGSG